MGTGRRRLLTSLVPASVAAAGGFALGAAGPWRAPALAVAALAVGALAGAACLAVVVAMAGDGARAESTRERLLDSIVENVPIMTFVKDAASLRFVRVNRAALDLLGLSREEMIGKSDRNLFPPEQAAAFERDDRQVLDQRGLLDVPEEVIATPRGVRVLHTKKIPIRDERGEPAYVLGISEDVTAQKNAREERDRLLAREHDARHGAEVARAASEAAARRLRELLAITDTALTRIQLSDLLEHVCERIRDVFAADTVAVVLVSPDGREFRVQAALGIDGAAGLRFPVASGLAAHTIAERRPIIVDDLSRMQLAHPLLRDRGVRSMLAVPLRLEGRAIGVVHAGTISPRRFTEDEATLLQLIGDRVAIAIERSRTFEEEHTSREEAQRTIRAREELLAIVSHDLRNPLNAVTLSAQVLRTRLIPQGDITAALKNVEVIRRAAERMTRLIRDLLDATRIEAHGLSIERTRNDPRAILAEAATAIRPLAEQKSLRLEVVAREAVPPVLCDRERILQVLGNLLGNAVKFTPGGGAIRLTLAPERGSVVFGVEDTGPGIPAEAASRIFERYWRADPGIESSGLGLYIAKGIVESHGGRIWVESGGGAGARFFFTVPEAVPRQATVTV